MDRPLKERCLQALGLFVCLLIAYVCWSYFRLAMQQTCTCFDTERSWWPFRFVSLLAASMIGYTLYFFWQRTVLRWVKK